MANLTRELSLGLCNRKREVRPLSFLLSRNQRSADDYALALEMEMRLNLEDQTLELAILSQVHLLWL